MILRGNCKRIPGTGWEKYTQKIPAANPRYFHLLTTLVSYLFVVGDKVYFYPLLFDRPISKNQLSLGEKNLFFARFRCAKKFSDNFFIFVRAPLQKKLAITYVWCNAKIEDRRLEKPKSHEKISHITKDHTYIRVAPF